MSKPAFSLADLQSGAKRLSNVEPPAAKGGAGAAAESKESREDTQEAFDQLVALYNQHDGDLDLIFSELGANPTKAKKPHNRPRSDREFAEKYLKGFYDLVEADDAGHAESKK